MDRRDALIERWARKAIALGEEPRMMIGGRKYYRAAIKKYLKGEGYIPNTLAYNLSWHAVLVRVEYGVGQLRNKPVPA